MLRVGVQSVGIVRVVPIRKGSAYAIRHDLRFHLWSQTAGIGDDDTRIAPHHAAGGIETLCENVFGAVVLRAAMDEVLQNNSVVLGRRQSRNRDAVRRRDHDGRPEVRSGRAELAHINHVAGVGLLLPGEGDIPIGRHTDARIRFEVAIIRDGQSVVSPHELAERADAIRIDVPIAAGANVIDRHDRVVFLIYRHVVVRQPRLLRVIADQESIRLPLNDTVAVEALQVNVVVARRVIPPADITAAIGRSGDFRQYLFTCVIADQEILGSGLRPLSKCNGDRTHRREQQENSFSMA